MHEIIQSLDTISVITSPMISIYTIIDAQSASTGLHETTTDGAAR